MAQHINESSETLRDQPERQVDVGGNASTLGNAAIPPLINNAVEGNQSGLLETIGSSVPTRNVSLEVDTAVPVRGNSLPFWFDYDVPEPNMSAAASGANQMLPQDIRFSLGEGPIYLGGTPFRGLPIGSMRQTIQAVPSQPHAQPQAESSRSQSQRRQRNIPPRIRRQEISDLEQELRNLRITRAQLRQRFIHFERSSQLQLSRPRNIPPRVRRQVIADREEELQRLSIHFEQIQQTIVISERRLQQLN